MEAVAQNNTQLDTHSVVMEVGWLAGIPTYIVRVIGGVEYVSDVTLSTLCD